MCRVIRFRLSSTSTTTAQLRPQWLTLRRRGRPGNGSRKSNSRTPPRRNAFPALRRKAFSAFRCDCGSVRHIVETLAYSHDRVRMPSARIRAMTRPETSLSPLCAVPGGSSRSRRRCRPHDGRPGPESASTRRCRTQFQRLAHRTDRGAGAVEQHTARLRAQSHQNPHRECTPDRSRRNSSSSFFRLGTGSSRVWMGVNGGHPRNGTPFRHLNLPRGDTASRAGPPTSGGSTSDCIDPASNAVPLHAVLGTTFPYICSCASLRWAGKTGRRARLSRSCNAWSSR